MINISLHIRKLPIATLGEGGGYSGVNFGHLKSEVFHLGGYSGVNFGHLKSEVFHFGGRGALWSEIPERGSLKNLDTNFTV